ADGRDHLAAELFEQPDQALPDEHGVIGHDYAHGTSATITVGPPSGELTASSPSTARSRSASPARPCPLATCAPPTPSSPMVRPRRSSVWTSRTAQAVAWLCLATLVSDSATTKWRAFSTAASYLPVTRTSSSTGTVQRPA